MGRRHKVASINVMLACHVCQLQLAFRKSSATSSADDPICQLKSPQKRGEVSKVFTKHLDKYLLCCFSSCRCSSSAIELKSFPARMQAAADRGKRNREGNFLFSWGNFEFSSLKFLDREIASQRSFPDAFGVDHKSAEVFEKLNDNPSQYFSACLKACRRMMRVQSPQIFPSAPFQSNVSQSSWCSANVWRDRHEREAKRRKQL